MTGRILYFFVQTLLYVNAFNYEYLDPKKLQTISPPQMQEDAANNIISLFRYMLGNHKIIAKVDPEMFNNSKDAFQLKTESDHLIIRGSTGVAAVWGFNYFLKKYCKSQISWDYIQIDRNCTIPDIDETVVANDRFRYFQNVCTTSYSFVWWNRFQWGSHLRWMALNGINLALAPIAQEALWMEIYRELGMTDEEINDHFTGPAFLSWLRMGNVRAWGGPLPPSWHASQKDLHVVVEVMTELGMIPVLPAFNGHVPRAFARIFPNSTFLPVDKWNNFESEYCCSLFLDPKDPLFKVIGKKFLNKVTASVGNTSHIYIADPFNEVKINRWSSELVEDTSKAIYATLSEVDDKAVWLIQNWMFVHDPILWPITQVKSFLTSVPIGRMLVLDLQSEQWPQYDLYKMYYGQPFIWCMLHNFGGTLGMFGNMQTINKDVYDARARTNSTMIGTGLTPEGLNPNYVVYDLMLESAWRREPVHLETWVADYAERRYGCRNATIAWKYLLKSVYSFNGLNKMRGKYVITRRPSFSIKPWAWYKSKDLFNAFKHFVSIQDSTCNSRAFKHDLIDVTRQALQYRAEQLYIQLVKSRASTTWVFNTTMTRFLEAMTDIETLLYGPYWYSAAAWIAQAKSFANNSVEEYIYEFNARNQITLWGPKGEISDYAGKQWPEVFHYYYIPRWRTFLEASLDALSRREVFDEKRVQMSIRAVEERFAFEELTYKPQIESYNLSKITFDLYKKWAYVSGLEDLPISVIEQQSGFTNSESED